MKLFKNIKNQRAQHMYEYTIIVVLIAAGIIVGGLYAIRAWNANVKGWEESVVDSFDDPLSNLQQQDLPVIDDRARHVVTNR